MNTWELEWRLIYSMIVAGKSATFAGNVMSRLLGDQSLTPFEWFRRIRRGYGIEKVLRDARSGNYAKLATGIDHLIDFKINLATCTPEDLERVHGIGPKTSRFFILWTRPNAMHAALDTHVLKWLRYLGHDAPVSTPTSAKYSALEKIMLAEALKRKMTPRELDHAIWEWCAKGLHLDGNWPAILCK